MEKKAPNKNKYAFAKNAIRRASRFWYAMKEVEEKHRVSRGVYFCGSCGEHFKKQEMQKDHIAPVVPVDGNNKSMDAFIENCLCDTENMQMLCIPCHKIKSGAEQTLRAQARKEKAAKPKKVSKKKSEELSLKGELELATKLQKEMTEALIKELCCEIESCKTNCLCNECSRDLSR